MFSRQEMIRISNQKIRNILDFYLTIITYLIQQDEQLCNRKRRKYLIASKNKDKKSKRFKNIKISVNSKTYKKMANGQ